MEALKAQLAAVVAQKGGDGGEAEGRAARAEALADERGRLLEARVLAGSLGFPSRPPEPPPPYIRCGRS